MASRLLLCDYLRGLCCLVQDIAWSVQKSSNISCNLISFSVKSGVTCLDNAYEKEVLLSRLILHKPELC